MDNLESLCNEFIDAEEKDELLDDNLDDSLDLTPLNV